MQNSKQKFILLVENKKNIALNQKRILEEYGYKVWHASCFKNIIEMFKSDNHIDLILMDVNIGTILGDTEIAEKIFRRKEIPVIFISNCSDPEISLKTKKISSYGYVVKYSGITALDASIKNAIKLHEYRSGLKKKKSVCRVH